MTILLTFLFASLLTGTAWWLRFGFGRGLVTALFWIAARATACAHAADAYRLTYHERLRDTEGPTPEPVVRRVGWGVERQKDAS